MMLLAADIGFGNTKAYMNGTALPLLPSYWASWNGGDLPEAGFVRYVSGPREDLRGESWLVGDQAARYSPNSHKAVGDRPDGKAVYGLQMLLGLLATHHPYGDTVDVVLSVHHKSYAEAMRQSIQGSHQVCFNQDQTIQTVTIRVMGVVPEGKGAVVANGMSKDNVLLLDIGTGTTLVTMFGPRASIISRNTFDGGFNLLVDAVVRDAGLFEALGKQPTSARVRRAIEKGTYQYGVTGVSIADALRRCVPGWCKATVGKALSGSREYLDDADRVLVVGGGTLLPDLRNLFLKRGYTVASDPVYSNVAGMYAIGELIQKQAAAKELARV